MRVVWDIESTGLLNSTAIDYTTSPYKLKDTFKIHCIAAKDIDTGEIFTFVQDECYTKFPEWSKQVTTFIAHSQINFDLRAVKLALGLDYSVRDIPSGVDTFDGREVNIIDTLVMSKVLNPDRWGGHGIEPWGKTLGLEKIDWRAKAVELGLIEDNAPNGAEFLQYHPAMLEYNIRDVQVNHQVYDALVKEWGDWAWEDAFRLEQAVAEIITRQEHRGFWFNKELAEQNVRELDKMMEDIRVVVEPILPPKTIPKTKQADLTPPVKQFLKSGEPSTHMRNFVAKHEGVLEQKDGVWIATIFGKEYLLPMAHEPLYSTEPARLSSSAPDSAHLKGFLVEMGWKPTQYKERDLTTDSKKKKLTKEQFIKAATRYAEETLNSPFCNDRCEELEVKPGKLLEKLLKHDHEKRSLKVYTNPTLTVGQEKEIDPKLLEISDKFPYAKAVSDYYTYTHRRNSILGGGVSVDPEDDEEPESGFLSEPRLDIDGRIPTPADTCGAATSRFKHRRVANLPRVTSLFGDNMRRMFGADVNDGFLLMGYDFDSLEAKVEASYTYKYPGGPEYGASLTMPKPNDVHSKLARYISDLLREHFERQSAKATKYCATYGGQPPRVAKTIGKPLHIGQIVFDAFWETAAPLKMLKEAMEAWYNTKGQKKFLMGIDGRKLPARSKSNLVNLAFQSTGVIAAKRCLVMLDRKLAAEGLVVDFFKDDWRNKNFCQSLLCYHDDQISEVRRSYVKFKKFDSKEDAINFVCPDGKRWSQLIENDKGYFRAYNRAGELAMEAVKECGEYYKLSVELTSDYMIGTTWANTH